MDSVKRSARPGEHATASFHSSVLCFTLTSLLPKRDNSFFASFMCLGKAQVKNRLCGAIVEIVERR